MKLLTAAILVFASAAPGMAQPSASRLDWTPPVTGVDAPAQGTEVIETTLRIASMPSRASDAGHTDALDGPLPPPCEPTTPRSPVGTPSPAPAPCRP